MKKNIKILLFSFFIFHFSFVSCTSLMERTGRALDGSAFAEKRIALYRTPKNENPKIELAIMENKAGEQSVLISLGDYPMFKLRGSAPDYSGNFYLVSLEYLAGSTHGWNEYTLDILGDGNFLSGENPYLSLNAEIEPVQITSGRIHRYDTRITGSDALTALRNRKERISATAAWMISINNSLIGKPLDEFEKYWKPVLFPEVVKRKHKPQGWLHEGDVFTRAEDIKWNTSYTERLFPEELIPVRNSGTMLRDWEEALSWIYMEYEWENIVNILSQRINLQKIK